MEIYIEYALTENFLFDGTLLYLAFKASRAPTSRLRIALAAACGAVFAVLFPLLKLPKILGYILKFTVGFLLCLIAMKGVRTKKEWGRYALTAVFFFIFSFGFGGVLSAMTQDFFKNKVPSVVVMLGFAILTAFSVYFTRKLYAKKTIFGYLYDCELIFCKKTVRAQGFWDSGNLAMKNGLPVCFASPELIYEVFEELIFAKEKGQVCDELKIQTVNGEKNVPLYRGVIVIETEKGAVKKQVYFAASRNMLSREYSLLLPSGIFDAAEDGFIGENVDEKSA